MSRAEIRTAQIREPSRAPKPANGSNLMDPVTRGLGDGQCSLEDKMIFIDLKCGRSVYISDFHYSRTYGGLLEGLPDENMNNRIIQRALSRMDSIWGKRRTHLIPPEVDTEDPEHPSLPSTELTAWITCHEPVNEQYMGSELVLVWYVDDEAFETSSIRDVTVAALNAINWNELADDFDW